jgi:nitroimidazol reductase NimA-like FMN-containing flavoprotein (pyridoxamine 5'-phosphate oxidase superfamily)
MAGDDEQESSAAWRGKIGHMNEQEVNEFLEEGNLARLAVLDDKGWPYVQPIWYQWDPEEKVFYIVARQKSVWAEFLKKDGRAALSIDGNTKPYKKVSVQGSAEIVEEPNVGGKWVPMAEKMATRYLGVNGPDYIVPTLDKPRWLIKITPINMTTWQGVDWHPRYKNQ